MENKMPCLSKGNIILENKDMSFTFYLITINRFNRIVNVSLTGHKY